MKITKRQLRRIIREEKQRLLEMGGRSDADRSLGLYANVSTTDQLTSAIVDLFNEVDLGVQRDGVEDDEMSGDMAAAAVLLACARGFQAAGRMDIYQALHQELQRFGG